MATADICLILNSILNRLFQVPVHKFHVFVAKVVYKQSKQVHQKEKTTFSPSVKAIYLKNRTTSFHSWQFAFF